MRTLLYISLLLLLLQRAYGVEDNNPCKHEHMEFDGYVGGVVLSGGSIGETISCQQSTNICTLARSAAHITDTFKEKLVCSDCGEYEEEQDVAGHNPQLTASYNGNTPYLVTTSGNYLVSVGVSCACGMCTLPSSEQVTVSITVEHDYVDGEECNYGVIWYDTPTPGAPSAPQSPTVILQFSRFHPQSHSLTGVWKS